MAAAEYAKRQVLLRLMVSVARRPLKVQVGFDMLRTVQALRLLPLRRLQSLFHLAHQVLQDVPRSIFWSNIRTVMGRQGQIAFLGLTHGSPLFAFPEVKARLVASLRQWSWSMRRLGLLIVLRVRLRSTSSPSFMQHMDTSSKWASSLPQQHECACHLFPDLPKVQGHVLAPMTAEVEKFLGKPLPRGWTLNSRCVPDLGFNI